ncbi:NACHT domain-containing protein [Micromonospora sp. NPDC002389]|uniref:NACHT domain-containing protein n=1 Tax=Micromonospora sp. NPDC002389 TaxID=3154272 RepID=UPI003331C7D5
MVQFYQRRANVKKRPGVSGLLAIAREIVYDVIAEYDSMASFINDRQRSSVQTYLGSAEFHATVRQLIALRLLYGQDYLTAAEQVIGGMAAGLRMYLRDQRTTTQAEIARLLFGVVVRSVGEYVEKTRSIWDNINDEGFQRFLHQQEDLIPRTIEAVAGTGSIKDSVAWVQRYCTAATDRYGRIRAPHWDTQVIVPIEKVYIPAQLSDVERTYVYPRIPFDRTVVLGDPGAGKTTLAVRVAADILAGKPLGEVAKDDEAESAPSIPFVVTLRQYAASGMKQSFPEYITNSAAEDFQARAPNGLVELLLLTGRVMVIFDGLDELVDTSRRREITAAIEAFAATYINTPILVTSRQVGYAQAPLDPSKFVALAIERFDRSDVVRYVDRWYQLDETIGNVGKRYDVAKGFLETTKIISDLTSSPLLLALLCNLYKATGFQELPLSRAAVLEKCALVLFDRWDRQRNIGNVDFERDFEPVIAHMAYVMISETQYVQGVTETILIELAATFLFPRSFSEESQARSFARSLIAHCRGRAWVLSDVGTTPEGEPIYQFSHRTFLEFYAALYICRQNRTPEAITDVLVPHVLRSSLGLVPLLTIQILSRRFDGAADDAVKGLIVAADSVSESDRREILRFALSIHQHVPLGPAATKSLLEYAERSFSAVDMARELGRQSESAEEGQRSRQPRRADLLKSGEFCKEAHRFKMLMTPDEAIVFVQRRTGIPFVEAVEFVRSL